MWEVRKIERCNTLPQYCYIVAFPGFDEEADRVVSAGDDPIGFDELQAKSVASILNRQIEDTEASLGLNNYNVKPIKEIN